MYIYIYIHIHCPLRATSKSILHASEASAAFFQVLCQFFTIFWVDVLHLKRGRKREGGGGLRKNVNAHADMHEFGSGNRVI